MQRKATTVLHPTCQGELLNVLGLCAEGEFDGLIDHLYRFGGSYNPRYQPPGISYYVYVFMSLVKHAGLSKFHVLGHHSGASVATEMAVLYPDKVMSLCLIGPALLTHEEQRAIAPQELIMYNKPVASGSHLQKSWDYVNSQGGWDVVQLHGQALDTIRAYEGRIQVYTCVFSQPMIDLLGKVRCPVLGLSSETDVLHPYTSRIKEAVSSPRFWLQLVLIDLRNRTLRLLPCREEISK